MMYTSVEIHDSTLYLGNPDTVDVFVSIEQYFDYDVAQVTIKDTTTGTEYRFTEELHVKDDLSKPLVNLNRRKFDKELDDYDVTVRLLIEY